jgi:Tfp pilus assembly protein PilP
MNVAPRNAITALLGLGLAIVVQPALVGAAAGDGALRGPVVAIAKARAAADQAGQRAAKSNSQAAATFDETAASPTRGKADETGATTAGATPSRSARDEGAPQDAVDGEPATATTGAPHSSYDATAHRDPFRPPRLNATADARTPLETYQLGQLKLVGVIVQPSDGYRAMVEDSAGLGYIIVTGTPIGSSGGVVRSIEPRRVVIEESTRDFYGDVKPKAVVMELPQEDRSP